MTPRQLLGIAGALLLALGVFCPIVEGPLGLAFDYYQDGKGDGAIALVIAGVGFLASLAGWRRWTALAGAVGLVLLAFTFLNLQDAFSENRAELAASTDAFAPLGVLAQDMVRLSWGWLPMVAGAVLMMGAGSMGEAAKPATAEPDRAP